MKKLLHTQRGDTPHWVGDGFPVRSIFTYNDLAREISPFLLMDYAGPAEFPPSTHIRGVGEHPHRGFETVTVVYSGEVEHRDSAGGGGKIGPGDVQWMTAGRGLVHEEKHGKEFAKTGGRFEMIQLWVNLPAKDKMTHPRYQGITSSQIPNLSLAGGAGNLRVIAGEFYGKKGPALTFSPIQMWDVHLELNIPAEFKMPVGHTCVVFVLKGRVQLQNTEEIVEAELGVLSREEENFSLTALTDNTQVLILGGAPLNEPIVGFGPFVMNTSKEIQEAMTDYENGKMGQIEKISGSET